MEKKHLWSKWIAAFILAIAVITVYKTFDNLPNIIGAIGYFFGLLMPFFIGIAIAFFLCPACSKIEAKLKKCKRKKIAAASRGLSVLIVYAAFLAVLVLAFQMLLPRLSSSITELVKRLPSYMNDIRAFLLSLTARGGIFESLDVEKILNTLSVQNMYALFFRGDWGQYMEGVKGVTSTLMSWLMGIIICVYALLERDSLFRIARRLFGIFMKKETIEKCSHYLHEISSIFYRFFFGKAIDSLIIGVIAIIGFSLLRVPYALLMGICVMLFNMIPYFGPIIGAVPVVLVVLLINGPIAAIWAALFILILQQVDANIIGPKILSNSVGVSPFWVIFAILVFGGLFGVLGMIIGVPAIAAIRMLLLDYLDDGKLNASQAVQKKWKEITNRDEENPS